MGVKISDLTAATTIGGSELTPVIQSTETRQTSVSALFSGLTAKGDSRYVCGISECTQGCFTFSGAGDGNIELGLLTSDSPTFCDLTLSRNLTVDTNTFYVDASNNKVGIGTTSPSDTLTIAGSISGTSTITTGYRNCTDTPYSANIGGYCNTITDGDFSAIIGGQLNCHYDDGDFSTIIGGCLNCNIGGYHSTIIGGCGNSNAHNCSTIAGTGITSVSDCTLHANCLNLKDLPTCGSGLPAGTVWRCGNALMIAT